MPFELSGVWLVAGWSLLSAAAILASTRGWLALVSVELGEDEQPAYDLPYWLTRLGTLIAAAAAWILAAGHLFNVELDRPVPTGTAFTDRATLSALAILAAAAIGSWFAKEWLLRLGWRAGIVVVSTAIVEFELGPAATVVAWSAISLLPLLLIASDRRGEKIYIGLWGLVTVSALTVALGIVAPPARLFVSADRAIDHAFLWSGATAAFGSLAIGLVFAYRRLGAYPHARWLAVAAGGAIVYLLSVGIVDQFQGRVGEGDSLGSLKKQAQVALSILWAILGGGAFVTGIFRRATQYRLFGLGLLLLATLKVFIWDMSTLDASYRVLSFIGLGVLLLVSSLLYQRFVGLEAGDDVED
jgi:hypothetical protein